MNTSEWEIGPIIRALMLNKMGALLIALQIAVTMAIVVNSIFIVIQRAELIKRDSGIDEANSFFLTTTGFASDFDAKSTTIEDLDVIRNTPGVLNAIQINAIPIAGSGWSGSFQTEAGENKFKKSAAVYMVDEHALDTLDVNLVAGENFTASDVRWREPNSANWQDPAIVIITQALAEALYPDESWQYALGKTLFADHHKPIKVKGIIDTLQAPWINWDNLEHAVLSPSKNLRNSTRYLIRTEAGLRDSLMPVIEEMLATHNQGRIIRNIRSIEDALKNSYRSHTAMIKILTGVMVILTIVTAFGIVGLVSFSVNCRKKQIGTRRALGASQGAIVRYFMLENFLVSTLGVVIGAGLTISLNVLLVSEFSLSKLEWYFVPAGMLTLWLVGLIAVFGPAKKAANIPPAIATRTA